MSDADSTQLLETRNAKLETDFACETRNARLQTEFSGFALTECVVQAEPEIEKYLQRVIRTALELSVYNRFGSELGGFWLMTEQIEQLRKLPEYYSPTEAPLVARAVEAYLQAQLEKFYAPIKTL